MALRARELVSFLLLLATLGSSGCGSLLAAATPTDAPTAQTAATAAPTAEPDSASHEPSLITTAEMGAVYRAVLERYVDRVAHEDLVAAASKAFRETMLKDGALPLD